MSKHLRGTWDSTISFLPVQFLRTFFFFRIQSSAKLDRARTASPKAVIEKIRCFVATAAEEIGLRFDLILFLHDAELMEVFTSQTLLNYQNAETPVRTRPENQ